MPTWMVVEDEPDIYDVLLAMFEIWGIDGVAFVDGAEAVSWIEDVDQHRVGGELPELALLDVRLPEVSGPEVGARLRASSVLGNVAIVLITAYHLSPEQEKAAIAQAQADLLLRKPLPALVELRAQLGDVVAKRRQLAAEIAVPAAHPPPAEMPSTPAEDEAAPLEPAESREAPPDVKASSN